MATKIIELPNAIAATLGDRVPITQAGVTRGAGIHQLAAPVPITTAEYNTLVTNVLAATFTPLFGARYRITDGVLAGTVVEWNGNSFGGYYSQPIVEQYATGKTRSSANVAGDATNAVVESITIPGYLMRQNAKLRITSDWAMNASASIKTLNIKFGGTDIAAPVINNATVVTTKILTEVANVNSYTAQAVYNSTSYGSNGNPFVTPGINTRAPFTIEFWARWGAAVAGETISLIGYTIELLP